MSDGAAPRSWWSALARWWLLRPTTLSPSGSPTVAALGLGVAWLVLWVGLDHWQRQPNPEFAADGIPLLAWYALGVGCLAGLLRRMVRPRPAFGLTLVLGLGAVPVPLLLMAVGSYFLAAPLFWWVAAAVALYVFGFLTRGLAALTGASQRRTAVVGVLFVAAFIAGSDVLSAIPDVWTPQEAPESAADERVADEEAALFEQADRIDAALEPIQRAAGVGPGGQAFFLGFAGVGGQKVFAQEIGLAARVLGERYAIGDRGLSLINDERDLTAAPLASVTGLAYALKGLAPRMHLDTDVLFLAISSHGSPDPTIAVEDSQMPFQSLNPEDLASALREAGIRWRVIVISACYAGGFIDALRDPQTIVITAAAADRTSFGCSNDSDLTYFGEAFYRDALPGAASLRAAFESAKTAIAARESREHETPSNPQAWFGAALEARLAR